MYDFIKNHLFWTSKRQCIRCITACKKAKYSGFLVLIWVWYEKKSLCPKHNHARLSLVRSRTHEVSDRIWSRMSGIRSFGRRWSLVGSGHEMSDHVDGQRKNDGRVLLGADASQRLQITKLQKKWRKVENEKRF